MSVRVKNALLADHSDLFLQNKENEKPAEGRLFVFRILERETGFEPATSTLARLHSTAELLPLESQRRERQSSNDG